MQQRFPRLAAIVAAVACAAATSLLAQQAPPQPSPQDIIPFDAAVRTATLPNGVKVFIRHNEQPAKRVSLRLAVKAGSIDEADDQQGLAHLIEHMAFNGSAHFKPGELVATFEAIGARLGPHVNAYTSLDRKSTRLNSSHANISYAVFCLKKKIDWQHLDGHGSHPARCRVRRGSVDGSDA